MEKKPHSKGDFMLTKTDEIMVILSSRKEDNGWFYYLRKWLRDGTSIEYWVSEYDIKAIAREDGWSTLTHLQEVVA